MSESIRKTDPETLSEKHFLTDIRAKLYFVAVNLAENPDYRETAIDEIDQICEMLGEATPQ